MPQTYVDFAFVKANASFEKIAAAYNLTLTGAGTERAVLCPFHRETKASCKINLEKRIFHCFGCGERGNVLEFVARLLGDEADLRAAALNIAEICNIPPAPPRGNRAKSRKRPQGAAREAGAAQISSKPETAASEARGAPGEPVNPPLAFRLKLDPGHPYSSARGLSPDVVETFGLGYCSRGMMGGRVCVPIHNEHGELVAYAGRFASDEVPEGEERYKLPAKFRKSAVLYNLHRAAHGEHLVLVEGYWSAIRLHTLGVPVAALMGSSISEEQIALLCYRGLRFVTLLLDGDEAGRKAREKALPELAHSFFVRAPLLPVGQKPDTLPENDLLELVRFP